MALTLKELCYYLNFDEATWHKNKDMLGYLPGEKYEDFFFRKHGFKHTEQANEARTISAPADYRITLLEAELKSVIKRIKVYETIIRNMDEVLTKKVKGYTQGFDFEQGQVCDRCGERGRDLVVTFAQTAEFRVGEHGGLAKIKALSAWAGRCRRGLGRWRRSSRSRRSGCVGSVGCRLNGRGRRGGDRFLSFGRRLIGGFHRRLLHGEFGHENVLHLAAEDRVEHRDQLRADEVAGAGLLQILQRLAAHHAGGGIA